LRIPLHRIEPIHPVEFTMRAWLDRALPLQAIRGSMDALRCAALPCPALPCLALP
jgi:hypothetical protein